MPPIYEFKCRNCQLEFEFLKIKSDEVAQCPKCQAKGDGNLEKKVPKGTSHIFKSGKWFKEGY